MSVGTPQQPTLPRIATGPGDGKESAPSYNVGTPGWHPPAVVSFLAVGLALDLVAFGFGMTGQTPALPAGLWSLFVVPLPGISFVVGATVLIECFTAAVSLADPRSTRRNRTHVHRACSRPATHQ